MNRLELTGRAHSHVIDVADLACTLHRNAVQAFLEMRQAAAAGGIELVAVSAFRDFDAQVRIWNEKYLGQRALYDRAGTQLHAPSMSPEARVEAILCWSAMPGASRHHWGSEVDVIDRAADVPGGRVRLVPEEYASGPFVPLDRWLSKNMARFGFFRPYATDRGGVAPEPWHLSYAPVSVPALSLLDEGLLREALDGAQLEGKAVLMERLSLVHERYVARVDSPPEGLVA